MSETAAAILILPVLTLLVVVLECSRIGCTRLSRWLGELRTREAESPLTSESA